jgi:glucose-6-phosphate 1-dehydrogenase
LADHPRPHGEVFLVTKNDAMGAFDMLVVGANGDLARRMLLPSLYYLHAQGLASQGRIFAVARQHVDQDTYRHQLAADLEQFVATGELETATLEAFLRRIEYVDLGDNELQGYSDLRSKLESEPDRPRIFYLAIPPPQFGPTSQKLHAAGLVNDRSRIVLEKPIGLDLESAITINATVAETFAENQIYRIDHYLGKETVQNLMALRFSNALFEPMWRSERIDHVQITVAETLGVGGRGGYYQDSGALRDMVQNHLLQLLCLVAMEPPVRLGQDAIRDEKIKVLHALRPISTQDVHEKTVRGQYRRGVVGDDKVAGYTEEPGVPEDSNTETFVALKAEIDNWRWAGVPFYLRTGKRMGHQVSEVVIQFKSVPHQLFAERFGRLQDNRLVIRLQPDESIRLELMVKEPGLHFKLRRVKLNLNFKDTFASRSPLAYERLLLDVIRGDATLFMHREEVEVAWKWIDPILAGWGSLGEPPRPYTSGTWGPQESIALLVRDGRSWYEHLV